MMTMRYRVVRMVRWFDSEDWLRGEEVLIGVELAALRGIFDLPEHDAMVGTYPVGPDEAEALQPRLAHRIDRDRFTYVVEAAMMPGMPGIPEISGMPGMPGASGEEK